MFRFDTRIICVAIATLLLAVSCGSGSNGISESANTTDGTDPISTPAAASSTSSTTPPPASGADPGLAGEADDSAEASPAPAGPTPAASTVTEPEPVPADTVEIPAVTFPTGINPVRITIPSIGVDAPTIDLSLAGAEPEVPTDFDDTGWYTQTRLPGEIGPAVIAGHIDSRNGPAVFALLDQLQPGDEITVHDDQGETRTFEVIAGEQHPKGDLPPGVFGFDRPEPELRLITCGGTFDESSGHYRDNYIVYAVAV